MKLLLRIVVAVGFCIVLLGILEFHQARMTIERHLQEKTKRVTARLKSSLAAPLWNLDIGVIEDIVETEMQDRDIFAVSLSESHGKRFVVAKMRNSQWNIIDAVSPSGIEAPLSTNAAIEFNQMALGAVSVYVTDVFIREQLVQQLGSLILRLSLLLLLVTAVLIVFVNLLVTAPLMKLSMSCRKMVKGENDLALDTDRNDEIGSLARSFSSLQEAVREKIAALEEEIGERKRSEDELDKLRSHLRSIVDAMPSILIGIDDQLIVNQWNREAEKASGRTREECLGLRLEEALPSLLSWNEEIERAVKGERPGNLKRLSLVIGSEEQIYDVVVYPVAEGEVTGGVIRLDNITEKVRFEEVLVQTEKMMSVGGLAAGMAHEINNPLAGIMQSVQVIENRISPELPKNHTVAGECGMSLESLNCYVRRREIDTMLTSILDSGDRASKVIRNMLTFSRRSSSQYTPLVINTLLERTIELAANDYDLKKLYDFTNIVIEREFDENLPEVRCDSSTMQQVLFNLLKNAVQATSKDDIQSRIRLRTYVDNGYVKIDIADNGVGMDTETRKRIFEPFFTTKEVGSGAGLGLSVCFFIVEKNHNGKIEVTSSPGRGTTFTVSLPL